MFCFLPELLQDFLKRSKIIRSFSNCSMLIKPNFFYISKYKIPYDRQKTETMFVLIRNHQAFLLLLSLLLVHYPNPTTPSKEKHLLLEEKCFKNNKSLVIMCSKWKEIKQKHTRKN